MSDLIGRGLAARVPGLDKGKLNPCLFSAVLTSCSSMAVGLEAELSATTRSQVEVTKILPDWLEGKKKTTNQRTPRSARLQTQKRRHRQKWRKARVSGGNAVIGWAVNYLLWVSCCVGAAYGLCSICVGVGVFLHNRIWKEEVTRVTTIRNRTSGPGVRGTHRNTGAAWPRPPSASAGGRNAAVCPAGPELPD